jgi:hypothetical protein
MWDKTFAIDLTINLFRSIFSVMQTAPVSVAPVSSVRVQPLPFRFTTRTMVLDAEWTVSVWQSESQKGVWFVQIDRQRKEWSDPVCFKLWTYDRKRDRWKFERRMCKDLPLPSHIVPQWEMILEQHGFSHTK